MRCAVLAFLTAALMFSSTQALAHDPEAGNQELKTQAQLETAKYELKVFRNLEFPGQFRQVNHEIRILEADARMTKNRIRDYERFPRSVFPVTLQNERLRLMQIERQIEVVRRERLLLQFRAQRHVKQQKKRIQEAEQRLNAKQDKDGAPSA